MLYGYYFLAALATTIAIETLGLYVLLRFAFKLDRETIGTPQILFAGIFVNFATVPYVWYVFPSLHVAQNFYSSVFLSEVFITIVEAIFYRFYFRMKFEKTIILSFVCNAVSFLIPMVLNHFIN